MKNILLFKSKRDQYLKKPSDVVSRICNLLLQYSREPDNNSPIKSKHQKKIDEELSNLIETLHVILYGNPESLPDPKSCAELTAEFFKQSPNNPLRLLLSCFEKLNWESQKYASEVFASLLRQQVQSLLIAAEFVEENLAIVDTLISGLFNNSDRDTSLALLYDSMVRECIRRSQKITTHVLESKQHVKLFLEFVQVPDFTFASHVKETLELLLTGHKWTVSEFLSRNYEWFFAEFNSKLLGSRNKLTEIHALKLLAKLLLDKSNHNVMVWYVSSMDNLKMIMNILKESKSACRLNAFDVFKLFVANDQKPKEVVDILALNRNQLLHFFDGFKIDKNDEQFEAEKAQVMAKIAALKEINVKPISVTV